MEDTGTKLLLYLEHVGTYIDTSEYFVLFYDYTFRRKGYCIFQQYIAFRFCGGTHCVCCEVEPAF